MKIGERKVWNKANEEGRKTGMTIVPLRGENVGNLYIEKNKN